MLMLEEGRLYLEKQGLPQWQNGTGPTREAVETDIFRGEGYLLTGESNHTNEKKENELLGYSALTKGEDEFYERIDGSWNRAFAEYITIHRFVLAEAARGRKLALEMIRLLEEEALTLGFRDIRIDTYHGNKIMRRVIDKAGFVFAGIIQLPFENGERMSYQKILSRKGCEI